MLELNKIYNMDCVDGMKLLENCSIDLTITSPPYDDLRKYKGYSFDFESVAKELYRITNVGGCVVWVVGDQAINGDESGTSFKQALYFKEIGFKLFDTMIYQKANCPMRGNLNGYNQVFEYMFVLSKGKLRTHNILYDRENKSFGTSGFTRHRDKNGNIEIQNFVQRKKMGRRYNIWIYGNGKGVTSKDYIAFKHPALFPEKLAEDHILSWSNKNDIILDPFMGVGTSAKMALLNERNFIGFESSKEYCEIANERLKLYGYEK